MGLKEGLSSTKRKALITSFAVAETLDIATTGTGFHIGNVNPNYVATEISPFGGREILNNFTLDEAFILKIGLVAILVGLYALTTDRDFKRENSNNKHLEIKSGFVFDRVFIGANIFAWGVVAWNTVQLAKMT